MGIKKITATEISELLIQKMRKNLDLQGWEEDHIQIDTDLDRLELVETEGKVTISCKETCSIRVPQHITLEIMTVGGNLRVRNLEKMIKINTIGGTCTLNQLSGASIQTIGGNLTSREVVGDLRVSTVGGNAKVNELEGTCEFDTVGGNTVLVNVAGSINAKSGGNTRLLLSDKNPDQALLTSGGNIKCELSEDEDVKISIKSGAGIIRVASHDKIERFLSRQQAFGNEDATKSMELTAGGVVSISFNTHDADSEVHSHTHFVHHDIEPEVREMIDSEIDEHLRNMGEHVKQEMEELSERLAGLGLNAKTHKRIMERVKSKTHKPHIKPRFKTKWSKSWGADAEKGRKRIKLSLDLDGKDKTFPHQGISSEKTGSQPSIDEITVILKMLEDKKISLDEAIELLNALDV